MPIVDPNTQIAIDGQRYPLGEGPTEAQEFYEQWILDHSGGLSEEQMDALATDAEVATAVAGAVIGDGIDRIEAISQAAYDLLDPPVATTLYVING